MKKDKYIIPEVNVYEMEAQTMMALSVDPNKTADKSLDVLTNERDDTYSDIWGNEY